MTLSRTAIAVFAALPMPVFAQANSAQAALAQHQALMNRVGEESCVDEANPLNPDEIVVCGRRDPQRHRLPLPVTPEPGSRLAGEVRSATDGLKPEKCSPVGPHQSCAIMVPIPVLINVLTQVVEAAVKPD